MKNELSILIALIILLAGCNTRGGMFESSFPANESSGESEKQESRESTQSESANTASGETELVRIITKLTIPEGFTLARIGMTLEEMSICTVEEFIEASETGDFSMYPLIAAQKENPNRCYKLEGYLFPDTYEFYADEPPETIIHRMLTHLEQKISSEIREMTEKSGYTFDEILTLASIIEKEAFGYEYMPNISSVLHNRLDSGMKLQCDVTINYVEGAIKPFITGDIDRFNEYYNTYKCAAIPPGAICNPGIDAIVAAINPEDTAYFYFVTDNDKNYYFSETLKEHQDYDDIIKTQAASSSPSR